MQTGETVKHRISGGEVEIDAEDLPMVAARSWYVTRDGYARSGKVLMHRAIMAEQLAPGLVVDHKNRNRLDNRRANLRMATMAQNKANANLSRRNTSGHTGVCLHKKSARWMAHIAGKRLGFFKSKDEAVEARELAAAMLYGEFAE